MKRLGTAVAVLFAASVAFAEQPPASTGTGGQTGWQEGSAGEKSKDKDKKEFKAQVVSTDATAQTITVRKMEKHKDKDKSGSAADSGTATGAGAEMTLSVDPSAQSSLAQVSAGDQVKVSCRKDTSGKEIVTKLERVDTRPAGDQPANP